MTPGFPTIVLFDMDGTTVRHFNPRILGILEWFDDLIYKLAKVTSRLSGRDVQPPPLVGREPGGKRRKMFVQRAIHRLRRREVDQIVEPCPGIYDLLNLLHVQGVRLGIISNGLGTGYGHDILDTFGLERYYDVALFREDIARPKPAPDAILQALEVLRPGPEDRVWYFGDRNKDIAAALAARELVPCPLEPFAYNLKAVLAVLEAGLGTDHIVMAWPDLVTRLRRMLQT